jgi:type IV pilus assembly protein PilM
MATSKSVWGIDIGQVALKALKLTNVDGEFQVEAFDIIEHPKILSQPDADRKELIRVALEQFLARNSIQGSSVAIAVPGRASFTRFVKLPPVEDKRIPEIVKFEAEQQIPFPIEEVIWRYQTFHDPDSPDVELGIFAMKRVDVDEMLSHFADVQMGVDVVQMAPLSLYNFMTFDDQTASDGATLLADVGADKTDLVVADGPRMWTRTIQIGGNNFTEALVRAFKLPFPKAEKLKRAAASNKYARQIFQAMRPVFADLVQEIQRSIGHYTSLHRESRFKRLVGLGNGFRLPGLQKFLEQNLNIPVVRIDSFNKIQPSATVNAPAFTENVLSFAVAYGLALQGHGQTTISTNLLPGEVARQRSWVRKQPWFIGAAAAVVISLGLGVYRGSADLNVLGSKDSMSAAQFAQLHEAEKKVRDLEKLRTDLQSISRGTDKELDAIKANYKLLGYRQVWPSILTMVSQTVASVFPDQMKLQAFADVNDEAGFQKAIQALSATPRNQRELVFVDSIRGVYTSNIDGPTATVKRPGFVVTLTGRTPLAEDKTADKLREINPKGREIAKKVKSAASQPAAMGKDFMEVLEIEAKLTANAATPTGGAVAPAPAAAPVAIGVPAAPVGAAGTEKRDPLFPNEELGKDVGFSIVWKIAITGDGIAVPEETKPAP